MEQETEMIDVVDIEDKIIGTAPRKGIHRTKLLHRSAHIFLFDKEGKLWLEKRAQNVDTFPGHYSSSAAGHLQHGESYLEGANREALEELGISELDLEYKHKLAASDDTSNEFVGFFTTKSEQKPRVHELTEKLEAFTMDDINEMMRNKVEFTPIFRILFEWYTSNHSFP